MKLKTQLASLGLSVSLIGTSFTPVFAQVTKVDSSSTDFSAFLTKGWRNKQDAKPSLSEDTLIIKYKQPLSLTDHRLAGATLISQISSLHYAVVKINKKGSINAVLKAYQRTGKVESISPSALYQTLSTNDPKAGNEYYLSQLKIDKAQQMAGNRSVTVAVIDQGADFNHPELTGQLLPGYNAVNPADQVTPDFHATHVSGIIAAKKNNGIGGYGINPNAKILNIDVSNREDTGITDYAIAEGILYAVDHGAKIINLSLGGPEPSPLIEDAVEHAIASDVTVVAAAGNTGDDTLSYPAAFEGVISVGSTNRENQLSSFSSYGPAVDLVAPGEDIYAPIYDYERKSSFQYMSGTSMAAPVVSGTASLLLAKHPDLTPAQVEYVLEHTATDLGPKGYDTKFAHGLVNPVAALSFDVRKIPSSVRNPITRSEILKQAVPVTVGDHFTKEANITKANEEQWIKFDVKAGEYIQTSLEGAANYDYKYKMNLYSDEGAVLEDVNDVHEGKTEGRLLKVPFSGTLAIGVKDVNGSYDDSGKGDSHYKLSIERSSGLASDGVSLANPVVVSSLPYDSGNTPLTLAGEQGDTDYFKVKVQEPQLVRVKTTGIPGVDLSLNVYTGDQLFPPAPDNGGAPADPSNPDISSHSMKPAHDNNGTPPPVFSSNSNGTGEGETLVFPAMPDTDYYVSVSNKMVNVGNGALTNKITMGDPFSCYGSSNLPYHITMESKAITPDEDTFPIRDGGGNANQTKGIPSTVPSVASKLLNSSQGGSTDVPDPEQQRIQQIVDGAIPYTIGDTKTGGLQSIDDEDWYAVSPKETGIYNFSLGNGPDYPVVEMYQLMEEKDADGKPYKVLNQVGVNANFNGWNPTLTSHMYTGLKKNEKYFIHVLNNYFTGPAMLYDNYSFTSKMIVANPEDKYEDNDSLENVKDLPGPVFTGNFAIPGDMDAFYVKPGKTDTLYGLNIGIGQPSAAMRAKYPADLFGNLYSAAIVFEDTNHNRKLDDDEYDTAHYIDHGYLTGNTTGSFEAKKGYAYIVALLG